MADIKISQLGAAIAVNDSDLLPIVSSGSTLKASASQVKEYAVGNTDLTGLGDGTPTGAISALNTAKQPKTLATPITIGGTQQTTVEEALGGLNTESQSIKQALTTEVTTRTALSNALNNKYVLESNSAEVHATGDGVKTYATLLNELATAFNNSVVGGKEYQIYLINFPNIGYIIPSETSRVSSAFTRIRFINQRIYDTYAQLYEVELRPSGSTVKKCTIRYNSTTTCDDLSQSVMDNGATLSLLYSVFKKI